MIDQAQLAEAVGQLDAGTRALLDLSLRRAIPDDQVAGVLGVDAASIPPRRARGIAQLADMLEVPGPSELAALLIAIPDLPEEAWGVPMPAPFKGGVTAARRAKAFRRVAVAASPLVALGAVMAAVFVAGDHSGLSSNSSGSYAAARGGGAGAALSAVAPDARHKLPGGVRLSQVHHAASHAQRHTRRHRGRHQAAPAAAQQASLVRHSAGPVHTVPVVFHPPAATPQQPQAHHHHAPAKPKASPTPTPAPTPAPVQTPSAPVSTPAPTQTTPAVQVLAPTQTTTTVHSSPPHEYPAKPQKTPPPQPELNPPGYSSGGQRSGSRCGGQGGSYSGSHGQSGDQGYSHHYGHDSDAGRQSGGRSFSPPGLFRKRHH